jgi:chorismate mutase/prephenate dehydratase
VRRVLRVAEIKTAVPATKRRRSSARARGEILTRVKRENTGPLSDSDMAHLFREIISCCLALEQPLTIAI